MSNQTTDKKSLRTKLGHFLGSYKGKTIFNFCYGFGASLAILGTMFKLLHLDGANIALAVGLGTEVFIFALSAFEPPFRNYRWEEVFPVLTSHKEEDKPEFGPTGIVGGVINIGQPSAPGKVETTAVSSEDLTPPRAFTNIKQSSYSADVTPHGAHMQAGRPSATQSEEEGTRTLSESIKQMSETVGQLSDVEKVSQVTENYLNQLSQMSDNLNRFSDATASLTTVSNVLLDSYRSITDNSSDISENSKGYVEQMGNLNRNLYGLNTIYEIQLKSISSQIDTIDRVNKGLVHIRDMYEGSMDGSERFRQETESMAENLAQLNRLYARMLEAMVPGQGFPGFIAPRPTPPTAPDESHSPEQAG